MALFDSQFYRPSSEQYDNPENHGLRYDAVEFVTLDGVRLSAWWFPADGSARGTVIHFHGNAGNITGHFVQTAWLPAAGYHVLCFDYRGFGGSEGTVTRTGTILDAHAAIDYVLAREDADPMRILLFGQSLGGAVAIVAG
ncbi:MAG: alpha/beta fold hydrolase, partial [Planctomycetes bacterium]|nr:alpha/beta fold hydrolase [Planctomycetota bacterium]